MIVYLVLTYRKEKGDIIKNRVEIFFKGGTKGYASCVVEMDVANFKIGETEYEEPILFNPRIEYVSGQIYRTFLFAEGIGMVDVPPMTKDIREKIINYLVTNEIIKEEDKKDEYDKYTDEDLSNYVKFYNFDIEQITDRPIMKSFSTGMNAFVHLVNGLISSLDKLSGEPSNMYKLSLFVVGGIVGFFMSWAFSLKGWI